MRIAVFSDSHGVISGMVRAVEGYCPDSIIHLGDCVRDAQALAEYFPHIPMCSVSGNCDWASAAEDSLLAEFAGVRVFMAHGHRYGVKMGLESFLNSVSFSGARLGLFGHTHRALCREFAGITLLNPGSCGAGTPSTWAQIEIKNGEAFCRIAEIE